MKNNNADNEKNKRDHLLSRIIYYVFFGLTLGVGLCSLVREEAWLTVPLLLQFVFGICVYRLSIPGKMTRSLLIYLLGDTVIMGAIAGLRLAFPEAFVRASSLFLWGLGIQIITFVGLTFIVFAMTIRKNKITRCTVPVRGRVVDYSVYHSRTLSKYSPVFVYKYNDEYFSGYQEIYMDKKLPKLGDEDDILIDPDFPEEIYYPKQAKLEFITKAVIGSLLMVLGLFLTVMLYIA